MECNSISAFWCFVSMDVFREYCVDQWIDYTCEIDIASRYTVKITEAEAYRSHRSHKLHRNPIVLNSYMSKLGHHCFRKWFIALPMPLLHYKKLLLNFETCFIKIDISVRVSTLYICHGVFFSSWQPHTELCRCCFQKHMFLVTVD